MIKETRHLSKKPGAVQWLQAVLAAAVLPVVIPVVTAIILRIFGP